ncbi:MAG: M20/M25/M40 family metallo-hydrolase [Thermoleophilia bacterium]|nr:M20/M25/M40 family metallo-hydrolase [Thermoleophilia bacterium]
MLALAQRLIAYDTSQPEGIHEAAGFIKGWLEARGIAATQDECRGFPVITATVGEASDPAVILHGHMDVVPAEAGQFEPRVEGDRLIGRGAYDMKAALAAMMLALPEPGSAPAGLRVVLGIVSDEESEEDKDRGSDFLVNSGLTGNFAITGEPTDLHVGVAAKGVLALRIGVSGRAAHGSTPWLGDNAVLRAVDMFRGLESLPFARESSELFDRPSINLGRIWGGDALNKVPDYCAIDVDIRYLPHQDPEEILEQIRGLDPAAMETIFALPPIDSGIDSPWVKGLISAADAHREGTSVSVGRDGASDAVSFIRVGIPAVEFGPVGAGHHGPEEWVSIASLDSYLDTLREFLGMGASLAGPLTDD